MKSTSIKQLGFLICLLISCSSIPTNNKLTYCGYELTELEYSKLRAKAESQKLVYEADSIWHLYDQLNDSIRSVMPDSVDFEIFLSLLNKNEIGIDIYVPSNKEYFEKIGCKIMKGTYKGKMPEQRYMFLYTYTNADGSGDIPLETAIKRLK